MKDYRFLQQKYITNTYPDRQLVLEKGEGIYLFDCNGERYIDCMSNYGVNIFGYNHPVITKALTHQLQELTTLHGSFNNSIRAHAAELLIKQCGGQYSQAYFSNSGAEAIEAALKFAVLATGKKTFVVADHGYHGKTLGALSATSGEKYKNPFEPLLWNFVQIPFNDVYALENTITDETAAFIVEPIQGEGGIYVPDSDYLKNVRAICSKKGILLIIDEIQTGCGRTGTFLASERVDADIVCLGKGLAGGVPVGATVVNQKVASTISKNIHTSTFGGNPLACAGIIATLSLLDQERLNYIQETGKYFIEQLKAIQSKRILSVRGIGFMIGLDVNDKRNLFLKLLQEEQILAIPAGESVIRFLPSFIITKEQVDEVIVKLQEILDSLCSPE